MRSGPRQRVLAAAIVALAATLACSRGEPERSPAPSIAAAAASPAPVAIRGASADDADAIASLSALVKLLAQEYALAVDDSGKVTDDTELAEAELFADQARLKYQRLAQEVKVQASEARAAREGIDALARAVDARRPPAEVGRLARETARALTALGPQESAMTAGLRAATEQADRAIQAEGLAGDYRVGVFVEPPRRIFGRRGDGNAIERAPPVGAAGFVGVVLRERRNKRFLPAARVTADLVAPDGRTVESIVLDPLWGDFPQYGSHFRPLPTRAGRLRVNIEPPEHARHGDMLGRAAKPAQAELEFAVAGGRPALSPIRPAPVDPDYAIGEDLLQGFAAARDVARVGDYRIGFIAEPPEPIWLWQGGPRLKPVRPEDTHHLEIVLQDLSTGLLVPGAAVTLTLEPVAGGEAIVAPLHALLASFQHYGETLRVPPGEYRVRVDVAPPVIDSVDAPRFLAAAHAEFAWRAEAPGGRGGGQG